MTKQTYKVPYAEQSLRWSKIDDEVDSYSNKQLDYWTSLNKNTENDELNTRRITKNIFIKEAKKINDTFDPKHLQDFFLNKLS